MILKTLEKSEIQTSSVWDNEEYFGKINCLLSFASAVIIEGVVGWFGNWD